MINMNPFAQLPEFITPGAMKIYVLVMVFLVIAGTVLDMIHKKSADYFFQNADKAKKASTRNVSKVSILMQVLFVDVLTSGEFYNQQRRVAHAMKMLGFITFALTTAILIFTMPEKGLVAVLWHLGALSVTLGGLWFWFALRVNGSSEGRSPTTIIKGDAFILSLIGTTAFGLIWSLTGSLLVFALFVLSATILFAGVRWSKFAHMFFKPAAAFQKRVAKADGSNDNLPEIGAMNDPELQKRYPDIPEYMGSNPSDMGLGIKREAPRHY